MLIHMHNTHVNRERMGGILRKYSCLHATAQMLASKYRALGDLKYKATRILAGPTQYANHRREEWKMQGEDMKLILYLFPLNPSSDTQVDSAHDVLSDVTLSESIVSQDLHSRCHIRPLQSSQ